MGAALLGPARAAAQPEDEGPSGEVSDQAFDETLDPYGQWVDVDGQRAWRPSASVVGSDFQPYVTGGHWVYTDYGWSWDSDYDWGWAPFHYGRWAFQGSYGWIWVPGRTWGPAWVDWRWGGGYVGWAPLPPVGFAVVVQPWRPYWCFVGSNYFVYRDFYAYRLPVERVHQAYAVTQPLHQAVSYGHARWYAGPAAAQVERATGIPVPRASGFTPPPAGRVQPVHISAPPAPRASGFAPARPTSPGAFAPGRPGVAPAPGAQSPGGFRSAPAPGGQSSGGLRLAPAPSRGNPRSPQGSVSPPARSPRFGSAPVYRGAPQVQQSAPRGYSSAPFRPAPQIQQSAPRGYSPAPSRPAPQIQQSAPRAFSSAPYRGGASSGGGFRAPPAARAPAPSFHAPAPMARGPSPSSHGAPQPHR